MRVLKLNKIFTLFIIVLGFVLIPKHASAYTPMLLDPVYSGDTVITGVATPGSEVYVEINGEIVGYSEVYGNQFYIEVYELQRNQKFNVYNAIDGEIYQQISGYVKKGETFKTKVQTPTVERPSTTSGNIEVGATSGSTVYAYNGRKLIGTVKTSNYGYYNIKIKPQKYGTTIRIYQKNKYGQKSHSVYTRVYQSNVKVQKQLGLKHYSETEKTKINQEFLIWASQKAKSEKKAVTEVYFNHGAAGRGDWYGVTPHGHIQVQSWNNPGHYGFKLHSLGGVAFYTPVNKKYGYSRQVYNASTAEGYSKAARKGTVITKYMLGDNGVVYELKGNLATSSGFGEYNDDGTVGPWGPDKAFVISKDQAAQKKLKEILAKYNK